jgi:putative endonuclease
MKNLTAIAILEAYKLDICFMNNRKSKVKAVKTKKITEKRKTGNLGEDIACIYLEKLAYTIIDRNYLKTYGELDIIAQKEGKYHFIEVKTVTRGTSEYRPEENVHGLKQKRIARTIQAYLLEKKIGDNWQFDVMTVVLNMKTRLARVEHMENIVL